MTMGRSYARKNNVWKMGIGGQMALYFENPCKGNACWLEGIQYRIDKDGRVDCHAYHRVRILSVEEGKNQSGIDLMDSLVVVDPVGFFGGVVKVDVSREKIPYTPNGLWVCVEWVTNPNCVSISKRRFACSIPLFGW